ncbi:MAG: LLM class flavin-dependent oxidoreductase [Planctomycetota bacterium]|nr:MAG: LLM class flavin-dependent oxidoreductase [Planctomycetota bacterium]REK39469.1 MAG: LLM class flavin-dependent oxidoreductase [Planctomycetota bacterium]
MARMMNSKLDIGVLDQSPIRCDGTAAEALHESVRLAKLAEELGYTRYWVAEHHNAQALACTSPEILLGQIAARTSTIRVGSGGVMLSNYSALKVAEQFRVLDALHPGRVELGIGRAAGTNPATAKALAHPRPVNDADRFPEMVSDLLRLLHGESCEKGALAGIRSQPGPCPSKVPEVWLLGATDFSGELAARLGLPFAFADFFGNTPVSGPEVARSYRQRFQPSSYHSTPRIRVALQVLCAPSEAEARFLASSRNLNTARRFIELGDGLRSPDEAVRYPLPDKARKYVDQVASTFIDGDPRQVRDRIIEVADRYQTCEILVVTNCYDFEHRRRSYELVAEACGLRASPGPNAGVTSTAGTP